MPASTMNQQPQKTNISGIVAYQEIVLAAPSTIAIAMIMMSAPRVKSPGCDFDVRFHRYPSFVPHSGQNLAVGSTGCPHLGQFLVASCGGASSVPHSGQNLDVAGTLALHFGQIMSAAAGACAGPVGVIIWGISTMPVPRPAPDDLPSSSAERLTVSMRKTSSGGVRPVLSQKRRSRYSGVVSIPSKRRSVRSKPILRNDSRMAFFVVTEVSSNLVKTVSRSYLESSSMIFSLRKPLR